VGLGNINGKARASRWNPSAQAVCDRCGMRYQLDALSDQRVWAGMAMINTGFLVCRRCMDVPNEQFRTIILPQDPVPRSNPRPDVQATPIYYSGAIVPTVPGNQNFNQYVLGAATPGNYPTDADDILAAVAALSGVPTPEGVVERSVILSPANAPVDVLSDAARSYLLIYNPTQVQIAISTGTATWGALNNLMIGPGEAWFAATDMGQGGPWQGPITAASLQAGVPLYAWEAGEGIFPDALPELAITANQVSREEGNSGPTAFTFTVTRTGVTTRASSVNYAVTSASANGADFVGGVLPSGVVNFAPGETMQTITISVTFNVAGDTAVEPDEPFTVTLSGPTNATITIATASSTILNDDAQLSISADQPSLAEGDSGTTPFTFTVTRTGNLSGTASVNYEVTSAVAVGGDFVGGVLPSGTVNFAPGDATKTIAIDVAGDVSVETDELFTVTLSGAVGATIGTDTAVATILNDDATLPTISISADQSSQLEGASGSTAFTFTVIRSGDLSGTASANYAVTSATAVGADFVGGVLPSGTVNFIAGESSKTITINVAGDTTLETDEAFTVTLSGAVGATIGTAAASATIQNDDATLSIAADQASKAEGNSSPNAFNFSITRSGYVGGTSSVNYAVTSAAANGADFVGGVLPSGSVSFAPGETVKTIAINVAGDTSVESDELFTVTMSGAVGAVINTAAASSTILNDDIPPPVISVNANQALLSEGNVGGTAFTFMVTRTGATSGTSSVNYAVTSSAAVGSDFVGGVLPSGTVNFAQGEAVKTITVNVSGDTEVELDELFTVTLSSPSNATLGTATSSSTIANDDIELPVLSISTNQASAFEGDSGSTAFTFTVLRTGSTAGPSSASYTVTSGSAVAADFVGGVFPSGTVSFTAGETTKTITVNVVGDTTVESDEAFTVTLSSPTNATLGTATAAATILNDDSAGPGPGVGTMEITNPTASTVTGEYQMFGYAFPRSAVPSGQAPAGLQMDVTRVWDDNSVRIAKFTTQVASLAAGATVSYDMSALAAVGSSSPVVIVPAAVNVVVEIALSGGGGTITKSFADLHAATQTRGDLSYWRQGPVATELRVWQTVYNSLRVIMDATVYANGSYKVEVMVKNDIAMQAYGQSVTSTTRILVGGVEAFNTGSLQLRQYQGWHKTVHSGTAPKLHVMHDIAALQSTGVILKFNLNNPSVLDSTRINSMALPGWRAPLADNGVYRSMPDTGGRIDIGPTTLPNAVWLMRQTPETKEYAMGQCEASFAVPWNYVDTTGKPLMLGINVSGSFWTDGRGSPTLTQGPDYAGTGWLPDASHQPNLAYHAALLTGERWCLDQLQIQAAWAIACVWPDPRGYDQGLVLGWFDPVRQKAWSLREVAGAALLSPDGTTEGTYFRQIVANNMSYTLTQLATWTTQQGQPYGWMIGDYGTAGVIAPWQQDYLYSSMTMCINLGFTGARTIRDWTDNYQIGRHLSLPPEKASVYNMPIRPNNNPVQTWAALSTLMDTTWSWTMSSGRYPGISYGICLCLTDNPSATAAIASITGAFGDAGTISTEMNSAAMDSQPHFDMRPPIV